MRYYHLTCPAALSLLIDALILTMLPVLPQSQRIISEPLLSRDQEGESTPLPDYQNPPADRKADLARKDQVIFALLDRWWKEESSARVDNEDEGTGRELRILDMAAGR